MFEQSFVHSGGASRNPWSMAASLTGQMLVVAVVLAVPLMKTAEIIWKPPVTVFILPHQAKPMPMEVQPASSKAYMKQRPIFDARLAAPTHIPTTIAMIVDEVTAPAFATGMLLSGSGATFLPFGDIAGNVRPPAPQPAERPVPKPKQEALRVSSGVQQAMLVNQQLPIYPPLAKAARLTGKVVLAAVIARDGTIQKLRLVSGPQLLVEAAMTAVRQWVYKPTLLNGEPVEVITEITVNFTHPN